MADRRIPLANSRIARYVGNSNTLSALIKADCFREAISVLSRLFWGICAARGITPWLERVGSNVNISDIPTRGDEFPFLTDLVSDLSFGEQLLEMAKEGIRDQTDGYFDPELLVGMLRVAPPCLRTDRSGSPATPLLGPFVGDQLFGLGRIGVNFAAGRSPLHHARSAISPWILFGITSRTDFLSYADRATFVDSAPSTNQ